MNYDLNTVDYIFDMYNYTIFLMNEDPLTKPFDAWENDLIKFPFSQLDFKAWLGNQWTIKEDAFETIEQSGSKNYRWTLTMDFYRGIPERTRSIDVEGFIPENIKSIHFTSQSLFLFEFLDKMKSGFSLTPRIFISIGNDLHITEFKGDQDLLEFLREVNSHNSRFGEK